MTLLSVNINKIATLRNARGQNAPNLVQVATDIMSFGAHGITVHPRPDERHIKKADIPELYAAIKAFNKKNSTTIEFNIEGYPSHDFIELVQKTQPQQVTLVPDPPEVITSNAGWKLQKNFEFLQQVLKQLQSTKTRVSLFIDPKDFNQQEQEALHQLQPQRIELYTEAYASDFATTNSESTLALYASAAKASHSMGISVNAGHDLDQKNLGPLLKELKVVQEVSIGHALICDALYEGLETTVKNYLSIVDEANATIKA